MAFEVLIDGTPTNGANPWIDSLVWGGAWRDANGGTTTIGVAFASGYDSFIGGTGAAWLSNEIAAMTSALAQWEKVANIDFVMTTRASADILFWSINDATMTARAGPGVLGFHEVPGYSTGRPLYGVFNHDGAGWTASGLAQGGYGYVTLIHELGHGLGLAHPHDGGSASDATRFPGVTDPFNDYGDYNLNQGIWTTMSYNDGWGSRFPSFFSYNYGLQGTPMALDVAAIQAIYGANMSYNTGNNTYVLPTSNGSGTFWSCIWDAGGTDALTAASATVACTIDLRAAPLTGANAGGYVSTVAGIMGGFTIANGVIIETATGGRSSDVIIGNDAANRLYGGLGNDALYGLGGNDRLEGSDGDDALNGGAGVDTLVGGLGNDTYVLGSEATGVDIVSDAGGAADRITTTISRSLGSYGAVEKLTLLGTSAINGTGNTLANTIVGNAGANVINGGSGNDVLTGGSGSDLFVFSTALSASTNRDTITDFNVAADGIRLENAVMAGLGATLGVLSSAKFWKSTSGLAHDSSDRIIYETDTGKLFYDSNGNAAGGAVQIAHLSANLALTNADFFVI